MTADLWRRIDQTFQAAVGLDPALRDSYLDEVCAGDDLLRSEVDLLLYLDSVEWKLVDSTALESAAALLAHDDAQLELREQLGHYVIVGVLGRGGMGEVYNARDTVLGRGVALKLLHEDHTGDEARMERFRREARAVSALNHPNILTIYELGTIDGRQFIATELIEGETLRSVVSRGPLSVASALDVAIQTARALAAAHRAGIVHRDIKPENIMIRSDGYVKVLDFGLAKLAEIQERDPRPDFDGRMDISSMIFMGTPAYMSPEQISGGVADAASDVFSLGTVLYEMLAGRPPFSGRSREDLAAAILEDDPPPIRHRARHGNDRLDRVLAKMLAKELETRYRSAEEVLADLTLLKREFERKDPASDPAAEVGRRRATIPVIVAIMCVAVLALVSFRSLNGPASSSAALESTGRKGTWETKASISSPRWQATPAVLNDVLYVAGGWNVCTAFPDLEQYDPESDTWIQKSRMPTARGGHGAGALDGLLYVVGGSTDCNVHTASVEAYDPTTDSWSSKAPLPSARLNHVVAVANGKLYAIGGSTSDQSYVSLNSEYDPASDRWIERAPMPTPRSAAAVAVVNGIIYVMGGGGYAGTLSIVEAYDPVTDSWATKRSMLMSRISFASASVNRIIYAFGGHRGDRSQVEAYDTATDEWSVIAQMPAPVSHVHAAAFRGEVFLVGGWSGGNYRSSVIAFEPEPSPVSAAAICPSVEVVAKTSMPTSRSNMTVGEIDGIAYAAGGYDNQSSYLAVNEAYDPKADVWTRKASMPRPRETRGSNSAVVNGKMYVIGGNASGICSGLNEAYDPRTDSWNALAPMPTPRCHLAVVALDGLIYTLGGTNTNGSIEYGVVEVYDTSTNTWTSAPPMPTPRQDLGAVASNGLLYAIGGGNPIMNASSELNVVEVYDPRTGKWATRAPMNTPRTGMVVGVVKGMIIVVGGITNETASRVIEAYDPAVGTWSILSTTGPERSFLSGITLNDTLYTFGGIKSPATGEAVMTNDALSLIPCLAERK